MKTEIPLGSRPLDKIIGENDIKVRISIYRNNYRQLF